MPTFSTCPPRGRLNLFPFDENAGYVTVVVGIAKNTLLICPTCGQQCPVHDHRHRKWRHLDTCQFMTVVEASVPGSCVQTMDARRYLFHGPELVAGIRCVRIIRPYG